MVVLAALIGLLAAACSSAESTLAPSIDQRPVVAVAELPDPEQGSGTPGVGVAAGPDDSSPSATDPPPTVTTIPIQAAPSLESVQRQRRVAAEAAQPIGLSIDSLAIEAPILPVGVEPNGEMEIPGAADVGWYRFGSRPGEPGSAVLAAHVDYNGQIGAFYELSSGEIGDTVDITFSDGTTQSFVVTDRAQYEKSSLPFDEIFRRDGAPTLVLITCGGDFNPSLRSYQDNVVLYAEPV